MERDSGVAISAMRVDGGAVANNFLMQFQSDILNLPVLVPEITDTTALGAAFMAAIGAGFVGGTEELEQSWRLARRFDPHMSEDERQYLLRRWHKAVSRARDWARED